MSTRRLALGTGLRASDVRSDARRQGSERFLTLATGVVAALPVLASTVRELAIGWVPGSDQGVVAARAYDVLTSWTPLVGPWSSTSVTLGEPVYHLGPLLYWLLALPARLPGSAGFIVLMGLVDAASVVGAVALAHRRGGRALMFAAAAAIVVMCSSLETEVLTVIWAPAAPLLPFTLLIFVCWSIACGEVALLPLAVLLASFVAQCHFIFVLPSIGLLAVALGGLLLQRARRGAAEAPVRRWALIALVVWLVCWSAPIVDQALSWAGSSRGLGNLNTVVRGAGERERPVGVTGGARAVVSAVGIPPQWLRAPLSSQHRTFEIFAPVGTWKLVSALAVLAGLVLVLVVGTRRRRTEVAAGAALALVLSAALAADTASFPNTPEAIFSYSYASWWAIPAGMFVWLVVGWSALALFARLAAARLGAVGVALVAGAAVVVVASQEDDPAKPRFGPAATVQQALNDALPHPGDVRVDTATFAYRTTAIQALRRSGGRVQTADPDEFGPMYALRRGPVDHVVDIRPGGRPAPGARVLARVRAPDSGGTVTVSAR
jgi:hypothetical protein